MITQASTYTDYNLQTLSLISLKKQNCLNKKTEIVDSCIF